jgi:hypothetical protein
MDRGRWSRGSKASEGRRPTSRSGGAGVHGRTVWDRAVSSANITAVRLWTLRGRTGVDTVLGQWHPLLAPRTAAQLRRRVILPHRCQQASGANTRDAARIGCETVVCTVKASLGATARGSCSSTSSATIGRRPTGQLDCIWLRVLRRSCLDPVEIEEWVLRIVDRVRRRVRIEDARVELKGDWLDAKRAARRIAGHANAARGSTILWVIGLDEPAGVIGVAGGDFAAWWQQVRAEFNELAPSVTDLVVPVGGKEVVALVFDTSRAPFVIKNPVHGSPGGGSVSLEVPWREGTSTRSATRADLITLLVPLLGIPKFSVLSGSLQASQLGTQEGKGEEGVLNRTGLHWHLVLDVYVHSAVGNIVVIPDHQCAAQLHLSSRSRTLSFSTVKVLSREASPWPPPPNTLTYQTIPLLRHTIQRGVDQVILEGPGPAKIAAVLQTDDAGILNFIDVPSASVNISLRPVDAAVPITLDVELSYLLGPEPQVWAGSRIAEWRYDPS